MYIDDMHIHVHIIVDEYKMCAEYRVISRRKTNISIFAYLVLTKSNGKPSNVPTTPAERPVHYLRLFGKAMRKNDVLAQQKI